MIKPVLRDKDSATVVLIADAAAWLDPAAKPEAIKPLIAPYAGALQEFPCQAPSHEKEPAKASPGLF